ncbi:unnamed protein product, partial [Gulo gulo]
MEMRRCSVWCCGKESRALGILQMSVPLSGSQASKK